MKRRIYIVLNVAGKKYKFFSIFFQNDSSYYLVQHIKDSKSSINVHETIHLLAADAHVDGNLIDKTEHKEGQYVHISFHPDQIHIKKRGTSGVEEYLSEIFTPQKFNENHFRLHCILTPAPISHLPILSLVKDEVIEFSWSSDYCPQVSLYEIEKGFNIENFKRGFPDNVDHSIISKVESQPEILLQIRTTTGEGGVWLPRAGIFGKRIQTTPVSKANMQHSINAQGLPIDISSLPDNAKIKDFRLTQ